MLTRLLLKWFIKDGGDAKDAYVRKQYGSIAGGVGIVFNILLFAGKITAGLITGAISVIADAVNNLSDAASSVVTLIGFRIAGKKSDREHPFGHGRYEYISGLVVSFIIILVGFELLTSSIDKIIKPQGIRFDLISYIILCCSVLIKLWMGFFNKKLSAITDSAALKASAMDSFTDCAATVSVIAGITVAHYSGFNPDGYIGVVVSVFIMYTGIIAARDTLNPLLGASPDPDFAAGIQQTVLSYENIIGVHDLIVHDYGPSKCMVSLHAEVPCSCNILDIHDTIDLIEMDIREKYGCEVTIHMDPINTDDETTNKLREQVHAILTGIDTQLRFHDFRVVSGATHTNLIFDVVKPYTCALGDEQLEAVIKDKIHQADDTFFAVVKIDHDFTGA